MRLRTIKVIKKDEIKKTADPAPEIEMTGEMKNRAMIATVSRWVSERQRELAGIREEATQA